MSLDHSSPTARWRWVVILLIRRSGLSAKVNSLVIIIQHNVGSHNLLFLFHLFMGFWLLYFILDILHISKVFYTRHLALGRRFSAKNVCHEKKKKPLQCELCPLPSGREQRFTPGVSQPFLYLHHQQRHTQMHSWWGQLVTISNVIRAGHKDNSCKYPQKISTATNK